MYITQRLLMLLESGSNSKTGREKKDIMFVIVHKLIRFKTVITRLNSRLQWKKEQNMLADMVWD